MPDDSSISADQKKLLAQIDASDGLEDLGIPETERILEQETQAENTPDIAPPEAPAIKKTSKLIEVIKAKVSQVVSAVIKLIPTKKTSAPPSDSSTAQDEFNNTENQIPNFPDPDIPGDSAMLTPDLSGDEQPEEKPALSLSKKIFIVGIVIATGALFYLDTSSDEEKVVTIKTSVKPATPFVPSKNQVTELTNPPDALETAKRTNPPDALETAKRTKTLETLETVRITSPALSKKDLTVKYLQKAVTDDNVIKTVERLKKEIDALHKKVGEKDQTRESLRNDQEQVFKALKKLATLTSGTPLTLKNSSKVVPSADGGYSVTTSAGIKTETEKGVYVIFQSGYLIRNIKRQVLRFVFTNPNKTAVEISNIYVISPSHGLAEVTTIQSERLRALKLIEGKTNKEFNVTPLIRQVAFFNHLGTLSSINSFVPESEINSLTATIQSDSIRDLVGFETKNLDTFSLKQNSIYRDGRLETFVGYSQDLSIRYASYVGKTEEENKSYVEVLARERNDIIVIERFKVHEINHLLLKRTASKEFTHVSKGGDILESKKGSIEVKNIGPGKIIGGLSKSGAIKSEEVVLLGTKIKWTPLSKLAGNILETKKGHKFSADSTFLTSLSVPESGTRHLIGNYEISSTGKVRTKAPSEIVFQITKFYSIKKIGATIKTKNYLIKIKNRKSATVTDRRTDETVVYHNPVIKFEKSRYISLYASSLDVWDEDNKKINGITYDKVTDVAEKNDTKRFITASGDFVKSKSGNINFDLSVNLVLREEVSFIEKIEGSVFNYLYSIDKESGELRAKGIGKLLLGSESQDAIIFSEKITTKSIGEKQNETADKSVYTLAELIEENPHITKVVFETNPEGKIEILSKKSISIDGDQVSLKSGKYNARLSIFVLELSADEKENARKITGKSGRTKFEKSVKRITNNSSSYYNDEFLVVTDKEKKYLRFLDETTKTFGWTTVYEEVVDLEKKKLILTVKPIDKDSKKNSDQFSMSLKTIKEMSPSMENDVSQLHEDSLNPEKPEEAPASKSDIEQRLILTNLKKELQDVTKNIAALKNVKITPIVTSLQPELVAELEKQEVNKKNKFNFEVGMKFNYTIEKLVEIPKGSKKTVSAELTETYFEDREGNTLDLRNPILMIEASPDFNTNKVVFHPIQIIYTDTEGKRQTVSLSTNAMNMEYHEEGSEYVIDGVPAYYKNQKIEELPTTIMLTTLKGVVEGLSSKNEDGLASLTKGILPQADDTTKNSFTEGVAEGAAEGFNELIEVYKAKSESKTDLLIVEGGVKITSIFIRTTPLSIR